MVTFGELLDLKTRYDEWEPRADVNKSTGTEHGTEHAKQIMDLFKVKQPGLSRPSGGLFSMSHIFTET